MRQLVYRGLNYSDSTVCLVYEFQLEEPLATTAKEKMMVLAKAVTDPDTANTETKFVEDAVQQLLKARRVLKCSYVYGYYLQETGYKKPIFEFMQVRKMFEKLVKYKGNSKFFTSSSDVD